jgi:hypothetical protein
MKIWKKLGGFVTVLLTLIFCTGAVTLIHLDGNQVTGTLGVGNGGWGLATLTANQIYKGNGASAVATSLCDEGGTTANTFTCTDTAGMVAPKYTANGTTAGFFDLPQGSTSAAVAPCNVANSICWQAPTSVTLQLRTLAGTPATGLEHWSNSSGSMTETVAAVVFGDLDSTVAGFTSTANTLVNPTAATDTQLVEISLGAGYLNTANKVIHVHADGIWVTGTTQTPTQNFKVKLCTVSGCGSGTVLTLLTWTSGAATASTTETWIIDGNIGTRVSGSSGTLLAHGQADLPVGTTANTAAAILHDVNTTVTSTIDLTAALFLDIMTNTSTQSTTKNSTTIQTVWVKP